MITKKNEEKMRQFTLRFLEEKSFFKKQKLK